MTDRFPRHGEGMPRRSASSPDSPLELQFPAPRRTAESVPTPPRFTGPRRSAVSPESPDHTTVFKKITEPVARRSALSPETPSKDPGEWRNVPSKDEIDAGTPRNHIPPIPGFVKVMGKPNAEASPAWDLKLPSQIANFAHDGVKESAAPSGGGTVLRSNYSDGSSKFTLLLQRPAPELETYLSDSGITGVTSVHDASCGTFEQAQKPVCARVIDKTVIMVMGFSDQDNETLANLIESVYNAVKNQ